MSRSKMENVADEKVGFFQAKLLEWYKLNGRKFYWRKKGLSSYQYVIAEVLLQRTRAETVANFYPQFIIEFPNWNALANAELQRLEDYLRPVGLYRQRSVRLKNLAIEMVKRKGELPKDRKELESIPFMGQYIANAVELIIFKEPSPLVDVNMARVVERVFEPRKLADIRYDPQLQALSYLIVNHKKAKEINWAILDFAALVCKPTPLCSICPVSIKCNLFKNLKVNNLD
ncbi:hypothetical protein [Flavisolibacter tropicus]|uniref:HhH-GPD domain-containing protein n=1 Tax=Flavisolibacter tropicus TaxID=1492898 RepID=A0A172TX17_9BACT|nr:hypothetical protein [Flavisolibacter tropicus]ANE51508.1 hypothetical protein SY85_14350 [Flavisolibacter tropicus]